jgi:hypothetical protein
MEIDGIWDMGFEIVKERGSHVNDTNRRVTPNAHQLLSLNQSGLVKIFQRGSFGIKRGWKQKEERKQYPPNQDV